MKSIINLPEKMTKIDADLFIPICENITNKGTMIVSEKISIQSIINFVEKELLKNKKVEFIRNNDCFVIKTKRN